MVVVLIIGILVAIALPTFLGARNQDQRQGRRIWRPQLARRREDLLHGRRRTGVRRCTAGTIETALQFVDGTGLRATSTVSVTVDDATDPLTVIGLAPTRSQVSASTCRMTRRPVARSTGLRPTVPTAWATTPSAPATSW
jgi:type II secretory pathway pseudopilin PulG